MSVTVKYFTGTLPASDPSINYSTVKPNGPARIDIGVIIDAWCENADGTYSVYATITGSKDENGDFTFLDDTATAIQETPSTDPAGFSIRSGWPGDTNAQSTFCMTFDSLTDFPQDVQVQVGVKGGGGKVPNSGFVFSKTKVTMVVPA